MKTHNKLIRDKIPEIIINSGKKPTTHIANAEEYVEMLKAKLCEEADEFLETPTEEEMADILEVLHSFCTLQGFTMEAVEEKRKQKKEARGGFEKKIILDSVE